MSPSIVVVAGGTGGHVMPALSLARHLHQNHQRVVFYTDPRGLRYLSPSCESFDIVVMPLKSRQQMVKFMYSLGRCCNQALRHILKDRPLGVISFGGDSALAWGLMAGLYSVPLVLHEQNAVRGRTNRLLSFWAQHVALTSPPDFFVKRNLISKLFRPQTVTGLPLRAEFKPHPYKTPSCDQPFRLLIIGGSQGAQFLNDVVPQAVLLLPEHRRARLNIEQQCPQEQTDQMLTIYRQAKVASVSLKPFFSSMAQHIAQADLIIARAGASTLAEIATINRPAILVPYPYAQDDHQTANAKNFIQGHRGWLFDQNSLTPQRLADFISHILSHPQVLTTAVRAGHNQGHDHATAALSKLVLKIFSPPLHKHRNLLDKTSS